MKKKLIILAIALITIFNVAAFSTMVYYRLSRQPKSCVQNEPCCPGPLFCQRLSLTQEQIVEIQKLSREFHAQADSLHQKLDQKRKTLLELLWVEPVDTPKIESILLEIDLLQAALQKQIIAYILNEKIFLTPEQRKIFFEIIKQRMFRDSLLNRSSGFSLLETSCDSTCQENNNCIIKPN